MTDYKAKLQPNRLFDMTDRVVVIVGGAGKLGRVFADVLAAAGAKVAIADLDAAAAGSASAEVVSAGGEAIGVGCDASDADQTRRLFERVHDRFGRVDSVVHNVMAKPDGYYESLESYEPDTWDSVLSGNLRGAFLVCREAAGRMNSDGGSIVITGSIYGIVGPDQRIYGSRSNTNPYGGVHPLNTPAAYSASKAGLGGLVRYLAAAWGDRAIRVNMLTPGGILDGQDQDFVRGYAERTPLGRMANWSDYSGAILFLCSRASSYMTGANLIVDGGWTAW